jgi:protoporphyrinogen oxidase
VTRDADVVVLGAGPAGLIAAYQLARTGRSVIVLERRDGPGGLASSFDVAGMRVDHGSHRLHPSCDPEVLELLRDLLGDDLQRRRRNGRIRLERRWVSFPPRALDLARRLPPRVACGVALDACTRPFRHARADTFAEVVRAGLGPTMANAFYDPYVRKIWDVPPDELSGELARRRVGSRSVRDLLRMVVSGRNPERGTFFYPRRGFGEISDELAHAAMAEGVAFHFGASVASVASHEHTVETTADDGQVFASEHVFSTLPMPALVRAMGADAPVEVADAVRALQFRGLVLVYLVLDRPRYTEYDAHYFPELDAPFSRVSEPKNYRDAPDLDPPDRTVLCAELPCTMGDERWTSSDAELADLVAQALEAQALPPARALEVHVRRLPTVYPVYRVGFERAFEAIDAWISSVPRVVTFGRQGLFAHDNTHHALSMGWAAAGALGDAGFDQDEWLEARERFARHVVND